MVMPPAIGSKPLISLVPEEHLDISPDECLEYERALMDRRELVAVGGGIISVKRLLSRRLPEHSLATRGSSAKHSRFSSWQWSNISLLHAERDWHTQALAQQQKLGGGQAER